MKIIDINKKQFLTMLLNPKPYAQGQMGIITLIGDKLYKIYYKDFSETYISKDKHKLDSEVSGKLALNKTKYYDYRKPSKQLEKFERLSKTKSDDLITGVLSYKGLFVGIEMNYYEGYISLSKIASEIEEEELNKYISIIFDLANDLVMHNIIPQDIKEDNIIVNPKTKDVKLIDLDGYETIYGSENYIKEFPLRIDDVLIRLDQMSYRLNNKIKVLKK